MLASLKSQIESHFGVIPNYLNLPDDERLISDIWERVQKDYLEAPFPTLFKEKLFAQISKYSTSHYCLCRHVGFLLGYGKLSGENFRRMSENEILELVQAQLPHLKEVEQYTAALAEQPMPADQWDHSNEDALLPAISHIFLRTPRFENTAYHLRHFLGEWRYDRLIRMLSFIRSAHFWTETHPDLEVEEDIYEMLDNHPALRKWIGNHFDQKSMNRMPASTLSIEHLVDLFDNTADLIQSVDLDGSFLFVNKAWLRTLGYSREELPKLRVFDVVHPDHLNGYLAAIESMIENSEELHHLETVFLTKSGSPISVSGNTSLRCQNGRAIATRGFYQDISERKVLEQKKQALLDEFEIRIESVNEISEIVPMCSCCHNIRDREGNWNSIMDYLSSRPNLTTTDSKCPGCK